MERHQAGQEEKLVEIRMDMDSLEGVRGSTGSPADRCRCFKCMVALAAVMGLIIAALVLGFIFHYFMLTPSCKQDAAPPMDKFMDGWKFNITCKLKESDEKGRYDIFTAHKAATYLIYGWVNFTNVNSIEVTLMNTFEGDSITLEKKTSEKTSEKTEVFFFQKVKLNDNSRISLHFDASFRDNLFHVFEL